jgi:Na+-translocating ferredoxin:NAD+ oxidoreductase RnfC subunit
MRKVPSERLAARVGVLPYYHNSIKELVEDEPNSVSIPLKMHIGAPAVPVVAPGDEVKCGQLIAACPDGALGSNIHASISGRVTAVGSTIEIAGF